MSRYHRQSSLNRRAIWKLAQVGDYRSVEPLLKVLPSASAFERDLIFRAVTQIVNRSSEPANRELFTNLQHQDPADKIERDPQPQATVPVYLLSNYQNSGNAVRPRS